MFVTQCVRRCAVLMPDKPALVYGNRTTTFGELADRVARCAGGLLQRGLGTGERVAILSLNSDRVLELMYGSVWASGVPHNVNIRWALPEQAYAIDDSGATMLAVDRNFLDRLPALRAQCPSVKQVIYLGEGAAPEGMIPYEALVAEGQPVADHCSDPDAMAFLNYTGGTTGLSKGVMLTHAGLMAAVPIILTERFVVPGEKTAFMLPLFHIGGVLQPLARLLVGNTTVLIPAFVPLDAIKLIAEQRIEQLFLVPAMIQLMVDHPEFDQYDLSCVKHIGYGGSPISEALVGRIRAKLPQAHLKQIYGQTEGLPATILPDADHNQGNGRLRSAGRPSPGVEIRIVDGNGNDVAATEIGEIAIRGPHLMAGYWNKPEQTDKALKGGWLHTGDAGYLDRDGYLYVVDRVKDMVVTGGENVYSAEVENALAKHPAVAQCAVIAIPDAKWGELVHAVIALAPGAMVTGEELQSHCRELIANYKLPRSFEFMDSLPLTPVGKVNKVALREPHWQGRERRVG